MYSNTQNYIYLCILLQIMNEEQIIQILSSWNFWEKELPTGMPRIYCKAAQRYIKSKSNKIVVISGIRRSGKTTLARQIVKNMIDRSFGTKNTLVINFEEPAFAESLDLSLLSKVYESYKHVLEPDRIPLIILDEIQEIPKWEKFVRSLQEKNEARIIITGSSSALLSGEFASVLTGRTVEINMHPLSFMEFLEFSDIEFEKKVDKVLKKSKIQKMLKQYMEFGSFPEVALETNTILKFEITRKIFDDIIFKDVVKRWSIKNIGKLESVSRYYISNVSSPITFNRISKFLNIPVKTVENYSKYLEKSGLIFFVYRFSFTLKEQENSPRKIYSIDTGIVNSTGFRFQENYGPLIENIVALHLRIKKYLENPLMEFYYYKDYAQNEVDFVIKNGLKISQLIQVCYLIDNQNTKERELKSLIKASKELKCDNLLIITWDYEAKEIYKKMEIDFMPLWKWLLN